MTAAEAHSLEREFIELKQTFHMALDKLEEKCNEVTQLRAEIIELKYKKKPSEDA